MDDRKPPRKSSVDEDEAFILQVLRYVDNVSSAEEAAMLERELSASAERRSQFVEICQRCWNMRESVSQSRLADQFQSGKDKDMGEIGKALAACLETMPIDSARGKSKEHSTRQASRSGAKSPIVRFFASPMRAAFAVAAILLVATLPTWFAWRALTAGGTIAVLTSTTDAKWNDPNSAPTVGDSFAAGSDLQLIEGVAEIALSSGANVCVAGPAVVELDTPMAITLRHGSLVSTVPVRAVGFTVNTPDSRVVDKGTTFGVTVPDNGQNEVHVFKGRVDAYLGVEADGNYEKKSICRRGRRFGSTFLVRSRSCSIRLHRPFRRRFSNTSKRTSRRANSPSERLR